MILLSGKFEETLFCAGGPSAHLELDPNSHPIQVFQRIPLPSRRVLIRRYLPGEPGSAGGKRLSLARLIPRPLRQRGACGFLRFTRGSASPDGSPSCTTPHSSPFAGVWQDAEAGFESQHSAAVGFRAHYLISLCLGFVFCETGMGWIAGGKMS